MEAALVLETSGHKDRGGSSPSICTMKYIIGNLLDITSGIVCHQVNTIGVMGGLASQIKNKWPKQAEMYIACCKHNNFLLGEFLDTQITQNLSLVHIAGQNFPGANTNLLAVRNALSSLCLYITNPKEMHFPYMMGCGMGGANWNEYSKIIEAFFPKAIIVARQEDIEKYGDPR